MALEAELQKAMLTAELLLTAVELQIDTTPGSERKRRAPVVGIPCTAAADLRTAGIRIEKGGDACWLTRQVKEVKRFVDLGQPLDSPPIELDSRPTRMLLADEPVADCVGPPAWCDVS